MKRSFSLSVASLALLPLLAVPAFAGPEDIVPRQHPVYDVLAASDASLWRGDVQLTRREVKERLEKLERTDDLVQTLRREFGATVTAKGEPLKVSGQLQVRSGSPSRGSLSAGFGQAVVQLQGGYGRTAVESAYAVIPWRVLDITVGKKPLRWGPGFTGGLLVGDAATSIPQLSVEKSFSAGRHLGRWRFTQFYGQSFEEDLPSAPATSRGTRRHIGGRRLETDGSGPWNLALSESFKATRFPTPFFSQTLPYYVYQNDWTATSKDRWLPFSSAGARQPDSFWFNYQFDVAMSYRDPQSGVVGYADYLLDDIKAPEGLGRDGRVPPRTGRLFGVRIPSKNLDTRLEWAKLDALTYFNASPPLSWERGGSPLGYSYGGNVRALFARFDAKVSERDGVAIELRSARPITTTPEQPAPVPERDERITVFAHRKLNQNQLLGLKLEAARGRATRADVFFGTTW
ncbi:MAG: capsule assembly Wzi family protein [Armatimonas sp.]